MPKDSGNQILKSQLTRKRLSDIMVLIGYLYIRVTTSLIMKKWSKRYFTLKDGIIKLWKYKEHSSHKKAEREINLVNYERKVVDKNNSTKNLDKYILTDIKA